MSFGLPAKLLISARNSISALRRLTIAAFRREKVVSTDGRHQGVIAFEFLRGSKVSDLRNAVIIQHDVLRLDVSVKDPFFVH